MVAVERTERLTPEAIVAAAIALVDDVGLDGFSMRKLAARLDVNPMTIYLRFENKDVLLDAVVTELLGDLDVVISASTPLDEQLLTWATAVRRHVAGAQHLQPFLADSPRLVESMLRASDTALGLLTARGFDRDRTVNIFRSLFWHAVGSALVAPLTQQAPAALAAEPGAAANHTRLEHVAAAGLASDPLDPDRLFIVSTTALIHGLLQLDLTDPSRPISHPTHQESHRP